MALERDADDHRWLELLDHILDRGVVFNIHADVALLGIDLVGVRTSVVVSSLDTYLMHATALAPRVAAWDQLSPASGLPAPEAVVRAAEAYLRQQRLGEWPDD
jgi:hypothetical protein